MYLASKIRGVVSLKKGGHSQKMARDETNRPKLALILSRPNHSLTPLPLPHTSNNA